ncbi:MAG: 2-phospho-L-lactate guanylyltransferase [Steroidobacteraceae bacterium]
MAGCWALVPIKARADCKCRLAERLSAEARLGLVRLMLNRVLAELAASRTIDHVAVVSPERDTLAVDVTVLEDAGGGLNAALDAARQALVAQGARELVVLPADLPFVTVADIDALVESGRRAGFALAGDLAGTGTNALYIAPPAPFRFQFGPGSRLRHLDEAARLGRHPELVRAAGLEFDLDIADDVARLTARDDASYRALPLHADGGLWPPQKQLG